MRDTIRDFMIAIGALAALFAALASYQNSRDIDDLTGQINAVREDLTGQINAVREDLAAVQGALETTSNTVITHVNAPGLHGGGGTATTVAEAPPR